MTSGASGRKVKRLQTIAAVGGVVYRRDEAGKVRVLLIRKRGGYWTLPKGKIREGESDAAALAREVAEETGLVGVVEAEVRRVRYLTPRRRPPQRKEVTYYLFEATGWELRLGAAEEIVAAQWAGMREAERLVRRKRVRRVVRAAAALLRGEAEAALSERTTAAVL